MEVYTAESGTAGAPSRRNAGSAAPLARAQAPLGSGRATVRTYRHGSGDRHLVTLRGEGGQACRILIEGGAAEDAVPDDIVGQTGGHLDLLVDFAAAPHVAEALAKLEVDEVWLAWSADPADAQARALQAERERALDKLRLAAAEVQLRGSAAEARAIGALLAYYGVAGRASGGARLAALRAGSPAPVYCRPGDAPRMLPGVGARLYVFGPGSGAAGLAQRASPDAKLALDEFVHNVMPKLEGTALDNPFSTLYAIPEQVARSLRFFQEHYWDDAPWRRIDTAWITDATQFGLVLDSLTSSSLGLAIELDDGAVLLFGPEGQAGAGLLPAQAVWSVDGRRVEGRDLLARTVFYKVGHHGGFDASAAQDGLALMPKLRVVVIPGDRGPAAAATGSQLAIDMLQQALAQVTRDRGYVLRTDQDAPAAALDQGVSATAGFFDVPL